MRILTWKQFDTLCLKHAQKVFDMALTTILIHPPWCLTIVCPTAMPCMSRVLWESTVVTILQNQEILYLVPTIDVKTTNFHMQNLNLQLSCSRKTVGFVYWYTAEYIVPTKGA